MFKSWTSHIRGSGLIRRKGISLRRKVAREAALLLYTSQEKEFKQAKLKAAENLGVRVLPSNLEVAEELDRIADELEGLERKRRLVKFRERALILMKSLKDFYPRLIGSVWRGTARKDSDIDIEVFSSDPEKVVQELQRRNFKISEVKRVEVASRKDVKVSTHIYLTLELNIEAEIIVRSLEEREEIRTCEIYGDVIKGLSIEDLQKTLQDNPLKKFLP